MKVYELLETMDVELSSISIFYENKDILKEQNHFIPLKNKLDFVDPDDLYRMWVTTEETIRYINLKYKIRKWWSQEVLYWTIINTNDCGLRLRIICAYERWLDHEKME